jgi:hypothetical protein
MPLRVHSSLGNQETPRIYGIRYRVARLPSGPAQLSVFTSRSGLHVWRDSRIADPIATWRTAPCNAPDQFRIVSRTPERLVLDVVLPCPALVRVGDSFYPGWRSRVDGLRRPVQELDGVRAVAVAAGSHRIEFFYRPASVYWGLALTLLGFLTALLLQRSSGKINLK